MHTLEEDWQEVVQWNQEGVSPLPGEVWWESRVLLRRGNKWQDEPITPISLTLQLQCLLLEKLLCLLQVTFLEKQNNTIRIFEDWSVSGPHILLMRLPGLCWWHSICTSWFSACWPWSYKCPPAWRTAVCPGRASNLSGQRGQSSGQTAATDQWSCLPANRKKRFHHLVHQSLSGVKTNYLKGSYDVEILTAISLLLFCITLIIRIKVINRRVKCCERRMKTKEDEEKEKRNRIKKWKWTE